MKRLNIGDTVHQPGWNNAGYNIKVEEIVEKWDCFLYTGRVIKQNGKMGIRVLTVRKPKVL